MFRTPRKTKSSLPEFKHECLTSVTKLSDRDAGSQAVQELSAMIDTLSEETIGPFVVCLCSGDSDPTESRFARRETIHLFAEVADVHQESLKPHLPKIVGSIIRRLRTDDSQVQAAATDTFAMLAARSIPVSDSNEVSLGVLLRPLIQALSEQTPCVQRGAARCVAAVARGANSDLVVQNTDKLVPRLVKHLNRPTCLSRGELIESVTAIIEVVGNAVIQHLPSLIGTVLEALSSTDWPTRLAGVIALEAAAQNIDYTALVTEVSVIIDVLEDIRFDKVRKVREAVHRCIVLYRGLPESANPDPANREEWPEATPRARSTAPVPTPSKMRPTGTPLKMASTAQPITTSQPHTTQPHTTQPHTTQPHTTTIKTSPMKQPTTSIDQHVQQQLQSVSDQQMKVIKTLHEFTAKINQGMESLSARLSVVEEAMKESTKKSPVRHAVKPPEIKTKVPSTQPTTTPKPMPTTPGPSVVTPHERNTAARIQAKLDEWESEARFDYLTPTRHVGSRQDVLARTGGPYFSGRGFDTHPITRFEESLVEKDVGDRYIAALDSPDDEQLVDLMRTTGPVLDQMPVSVAGRVIVRSIELLGRDARHADLSFDWISQALEIKTPIPKDIINWLLDTLSQYAADLHGQWTIRAAKLYTSVRKRF